MTIPSLPGYSDYTLSDSFEHPNCYIGVYYRTSSYSVSNPHYWRFSTFDKSNLIELSTQTILYSPWNGDNGYFSYPKGFVSLIDDVVWIWHQNVGIESWSIDGSGVPSLIQMHNEDTQGGSWVNGICETTNHIWMAYYGQWVAAYTKTGTGTLSVGASNVLTQASAAFWFSPGASNQVRGPWFEPISDHVIFHDVDTYNIRSFDASLLTQTDLVNIGSDSPLSDYATDDHATIKPYIYEVRNGVNQKTEINIDGTFSQLENINSTINPYNILVQQHAANIWAWLKFEDSYDGITWNDSSGFERDFTFGGTHSLDDPIFNTHSIDNTINSSLFCDDHTAYATRSEFSWITGQNSNFSMTFWFKANAFTNSINIVELANNATNCMEITLTSSAKLHFGLWNNSSWQYCLGPYIKLNTVYHIAITYSTTAGMKLYVNGVLYGTNTWTGGYVGFSPNKTNITRHTWHDINTAPLNEHRLNGWLGEVLILTKELTASDIDELYQEGLNTPLAGTYKEQILALSPLAYYPCDDAQYEAIDISGHGYNAIANNGVTFQNAGYFEGDSILTDGTTGTYLVSPTLPVTSKTQITLEGWIYHYPDDDHTISLTDMIMSLHNTTDATRLEFYNYDVGSSGGFYAQASGGGSTFSPHLFNHILTSQWNHVVLVLDTSLTKLSLWLNGVEVISNTSVTIPALEYDSVFTFGGKTTVDYPTKARFQHVAVYDFALSEAQIVANYEKGKSLASSVPTAVNAYEQIIIDDEPVAYFPLDETSGGVAFDRMDRTKGLYQSGSADTMSVAEGLFPGQPCLQFNGTSEYIKISEALPVGDFNTLSFEFLCKVDDESVARNPISAAETGGWNFNRLATNNIISSLWASNTGGTYAQCETTKSIQTWKKDHFLVTWDGQFLKIYRDGVFIVELNAGSANGQIQHAAFVGLHIASEFATGGTATTFWKGKIAHVAMYDKVLTAADAKKRWLLSRGYDYLTFPATSLKQTVIDSAPKLFFPLDENDITVDENGCVELMCQGTSLPGSYNSTSHPVPLVATILNDGFDTYSRSFRGYDYVEFNESNDVLPSVDDSDFTVECFIQTTDNVGSTVHIFCGFYDSTPNRIMYVGLVPDTGAIRLFNGVTPTDFGGSFNDGVTHHIVVTFNGTTGVYTLYVDGVNTGTVSSSTMPWSTLDRIIVGGHVSSGPTYSNFFIGTLANVAIYDSILPTVDIANHFKTSIGYSIQTDAYSTQIVSLSPVAYYRLDEVVNSTLFIDYMDNHNGSALDIVFGNDGALVDYSNGCAYCDGISSQGRIYNQILNNSGDFTLEVWVKVPSGGHATIVRGQDGFGAGWSVNIQLTESYVTGAIVYSNPSNTQIPISHTMEIAANVWHHVVIVWRDGVSLTLYFDGLDMGSSTTTGTTLRSSSYGWQFGKNVTGAFFQEGYYDEIAIYDTALSGAQIVSNYILGKSLTGKFEGEVISDVPAIWWSWDTDVTVANEKFNTYNGTFSNGATPTAYPLHAGSTKSCHFPDASTNPYMQPDTADLDTPVLFSNTLTIETWMILSEYDYAGQTRVIFNDGGYNNGYILGSYNYSFGIFIRDGGTSYTCTIPVQNLPYDIPIHVIGVIDTNSISLYINGRLAAETTGITITGFNGNVGTRIGRLNASGDDPASGSGSLTDSSWEGYIDDVILYDGLFNATDALEHYEAGCLLSSYEEIVYRLLPCLWLTFDTFASTFTDKINHVVFTVNSSGGGNMTITEQTDGYVNSAVNLDGPPHDSTGDSGNHLISAPYSSFSSIIHIARDWSVSAWLRPESYTENRVSMYYTFSDGSNKNPLLLYCSYDYATDRSYFNFYTDSLGTDFYLTSNERFPTDVWYHIVFTCEESGGTLTYRAWVNNVELTWVASNTKPDDTTVASTITMNIGGLYYQYNDYSYYYYKGDIDEVMHFNRALTPTEIGELYTATQDQYQITGTVTQDGVPVQRAVRLYTRTDGQLVKEVQSETDGTFDIRWRYYYDPAIEFYVVAFDDDDPIQLEPIAQDRIVPVLVT